MHPLLFLSLFHLRRTRPDGRNVPFPVVTAEATQALRGHEEIVVRVLSTSRVAVTPLGDVFMFASDFSGAFCLNGQFEHIVV